MIEQFFFSIAGKRTNKVIDDLLVEFLSEPSVPSNVKKIIKHTQKVAEAGSYPSESYYSTFYSNSGLVYKSIAEIVTYCKSTTDLFKRQALEKKIISTINDADSHPDLVSKIQGLLDSQSIIENVEVDAEPILYGTYKKQHVSKGLNIGIAEIDEVTHGLQPGNICSVCGFTSHGKSQTVDSITFKNALEGKKCLIFSLEVAPELVWPQFEARYMYQVKGLQVTTQDFIHGLLPSDIEKKVLEYEDDFKKDLSSNLIILDESSLNKEVVLNYKSLSALIRKVTSKLGGLDLVVFDHVGQFELLYPDCGNQIIKTIQSFTKTFKDERGVRPVTLFAVQTNRQGEQRARRRNGIYDLQAISELNEIEKSSSNIIFLFTSDDMKIMQETKMTLSKNRFGPVITEPVVTTFNPTIMTVGATVEAAMVSEEDFNGMDLDLGSGFDSFDDF